MQQRVLTHGGLRLPDFSLFRARTAWLIRRYLALLAANFAVVMSSGGETSLAVLN
jgi:hypothetical protein